MLLLRRVVNKAVGYLGEVGEAKANAGGFAHDVVPPAGWDVEEVAGLQRDVNGGGAAELRVGLRFRVEQINAAEDMAVVIHERHLQCWDKAKALFTIDLNEQVMC